MVILVWVRLGGNSNLLIYLVAEAVNKSSLAIEREDIGVTTFSNISFILGISIIGFAKIGFTNCGNIPFGIFGFDADDCAPNSGMVFEDPITVAADD